MNTNIGNKKIPDEVNPHMFLEECKYIVKEKGMSEYINDDIEISYDDSDRENSDEENSGKENSDEKRYFEENQVYNAFSFYIFHISH